MNKFKEIQFLLNLPNIGAVTVYKKFGSKLQDGLNIEELKEFIASEDERLIPYFDEAENKAESLYKRFSNSQDTITVTIYDDAFPAKLKSFLSKTLFVHVKGNSEILEQPNIAFIGTRNPTEWTKKVEHALVNRVINETGRVIVSGLAIGCDEISHKVAVKNNHPTIAVLPCGFNNISPKKNENLAKEIINTGGCLLSTYDLNERAEKYYFNERDEIVAELSDGTIVIQCDKESGTIYTAKKALKFNKPVGCNIVYGSDAVYSGNDMLVSKYKAAQISNRETLQLFLEQINNHSIEAKQMTLFDGNIGDLN